jgi:hypothetical protein
MKRPVSFWVKVLVVFFLFYLVFFSGLIVARKTEGFKKCKNIYCNPSKWGG